MLFKKRKPRTSLSAKFIALTGSMILFTSLIIALFVIRDEMSNTFEELLNHGRSVASIMAQNSEYSIYTEDQFTLGQLVESVQTDPDIAYVVVMNADKKILKHKAAGRYIQIPTVLRENSIGKNDQMVWQEFRNEQDGNQYIDIMTPVVSRIEADYAGALLQESGAAGPKVIGYVQIGLTKETLRKRLSHFVYSTLLFTAVLVLMGVWFTVYLTRRITSPIDELREATKDISEGRLDHRVRIKSNDEISDLAKAFNQMMMRLKGYHSQIEERTAELSDANRQMALEIVERKRAEENVSEARSRLQYLLTSSPAIVYSCKPEGVFPATFVSDNIETQLGYMPEEFLKDSNFWVDHMHPQDAPVVLANMDFLFERGHHVIEYRFKQKFGSYCWIRDESRLVRDADGKPLEIIGCMTDITERKKLEEQLVHDALHDALTGLPNRTLLMDRLGVSCARATRRENYMFAVLFLDLDQFKNINDSLGHAIGDQLLTGVANKLKELMRSGDTVARLGGDEFAIILDDIKEVSYATTVAERIHRELGFPFNLDGNEVFTSTSIGISYSDLGYDRPEHLLRDADTAMYQAKTQGRGRHVVFDTPMHVHVVDSLRLENDMRRAVERNEFVVHYQPVIALETGAIAGFEALVRWHHPVRGLVMPDEFIRAAEETGIIVQIGSFVLNEASRQINEWNERYPSDEPLTVSVNISAKQFSPNLVDIVKKAVRDTGADPANIGLEITESMIMHHPDSAATILSQLREENIKVYIDDFGTGYSSLSYLQKFHIDALKIDQSFVDKISTDEETMEIVRAITTLAHNLKMEVIAEGVETALQLEQLRKLDCEFVQGFLFYKPLDAKSVESLFESQVYR